MRAASQDVTAPVLDPRIDVLEQQLHDVQQQLAAIRNQCIGNDAAGAVTGLNFDPFAAASAGGSAGGKQDVWRVGLNWYPTAGIRFGLDYDNIKVRHIDAPASAISADAFTIRSQIFL